MSQQPSKDDKEEEVAQQDFTDRMTEPIDVDNLEGYVGNLAQHHLSGTLKGGPGSGNFDHGGRPGEVGGAGSGQDSWTDVEGSTATHLTIPISDVLHPDWWKNELGKQDEVEYIRGMKEHIQTGGKMEVVTAHSIGGGKYMLNDGNHRLQAAQDLGHTNIRIRLTKVGEKK